MDDRRHGEENGRAILCGELYTISFPLLFLAHCFFVARYDFYGTWSAQWLAQNSNTNTTNSNNSNYRNNNNSIIRPGLIIGLQQHLRLSTMCYADINNAGKSVPIWYQKCRGALFWSHESYDNVAGLCLVGTGLTNSPIAPRWVAHTGRRSERLLFNKPYREPTVFLNSGLKKKRSDFVASSKTNGAAVEVQTN